MEARVRAADFEHTHLVMPGEANTLGTAFGGMISAWTDPAAAMAAMRHARCPVVTVTIDQLTFLAPIQIGEMADLAAQVTAVFRTSDVPPLLAESENERRREPFTTAADPARLAARRRASTARHPRSI